MKDWIDFFMSLGLVVLNFLYIYDNRKKYKENPSELLLKRLKFYCLTFVITVIASVIYLVFLICR